MDCPIDRKSQDGLVGILEIEVRALSGDPLNGVLGGAHHLHGEPNPGERLWTETVLLEFVGDGFGNGNRGEQPEQGQLVNLGEMEAWTGVGNAWHHPDVPQATSSSIVFRSRSTRSTYSGPHSCTNTAREVRPWR